MALRKDNKRLFSAKEIMNLINEILDENNEKAEHPFIIKTRS